MTLHTTSILSLQDYVPPRIWLADVLDVVCRQFSIPHRVITGKARDIQTVRARFAYCYLARQYTQQSFPQIAAKISRDYSTAKNASKKVIQDAGFYNPELSRCISELQRKSIPEPQPSVPRTAVEATGAVPQASAPVAPPISRVLP